MWIRQDIMQKKNNMQDKDCHKGNDWDCGIISVPSGCTSMAPEIIRMAMASMLHTC